MGNRLSSRGSVLRNRLASYLGRDHDRAFLGVLGALILLWAMATAVLFGCGAYQKLAAMPQLSPFEPSWSAESCTTAVPGSRCLLPLPRPRRA